MIIKNLSAALLAIIGTVCFAQDFNNYRPLVSSGNIPKDFTTLSIDKFKQDITEVKSDKRSERKTKEKFLLESNYLIDELLLSGRVLFNDPISNYVERVASNLLKDQPELKSQLRFYVIKSTAVNALATNNGIILVTMGLIAQLENEAQLAYILSHEIIHYTHKHNINSYVETSRILKGKDSYRGSSVDDKILARSNYSKELETEADKKGLTEFFEKSPYASSAINGVFDVLQYAYLPIDDVEFNKSYFEKGDFIFPDTYFMEEISKIKTNEDYDDSKSTHPSTAKRREAIARMTKDLKNENKSMFILPKTDFDQVKNISRFELTRLYLIRRDYGNALYNSFLLLRDFPNNAYLEKSIATSLYAVSKYKNEGLASQVLHPFKNIEGHSQQVFHLLFKMSKKESTILALKYSWEINKKHPGDNTLEKIVDELFYDLVYVQKNQPKDFFDKSKNDLIHAHLRDSLAEQKPAEELSKYEKIKRKKTETLGGDEDFWRFAFVDISKEKEFSTKFNELVEQRISEEDERDRIKTREERKTLANKIKKDKKFTKKYGYALGINKIVLVNPVYVKVDQRKKDNVKYIDSEISQLDFVKKINENANISGVEVNILDAKTFKENDVEAFNDYSLMRDWMNERFNHDSQMKIVSSETNNIHEISKKHNTKYFNWMGAVAYRQKKNDIGYYLCLSAVGIYTLPLGIIYALTPGYYTYYYNILFDVETGKMEMLISVGTNRKDRDSLLNSKIYDTFIQMKNKPRNK
ncbi:MAG: M48 family metalloprotease [Bacteroidetes bacterium]|nr:M48 family metalloprotease [Bacteroidota bacterium]HET6244575.1 M48 family metallopeptidase [Bacteroidia bacterium]